MATVDYGLSGNTMKILGEAAKAEAGVGKYASEGFDNFLDTVGEYAGKKMDEAAAEKQAIEDKFNKASEDALAIGGSLPTNYFDSFDSNGFTVGGGGYTNTNASGSTYVGWSWKANGGTTSSNSNGSITSTVQANTTAGFSIVSYTGTGSNATVGLH